MSNKIMRFRKVVQILALCSGLMSAWVQAWDDRRLGTPLVIDDLIVPYPVFSKFYLPGETFSVHFKDALHGGELTFNGVTFPVGQEKLIAPPTPGVYPLTIVNPKGGEQATVNIFVMAQASSMDKKGRLNGYHIDAYPAEPLHGNPIYLPPRGFVEVNEKNKDLRISPNFRLGQFTSKQSQGFPKYLVLRPRLLLKLENILATLNREGLSVGAFEIMSGYRTPFYNRSIGNVQYSRHVWGGAADFYIDENPRDGVMDDLNKDGKVDRHDAVWLATFIDKMSRRGAFGDRIGGIGIYGRNSAHGPFVHVDVRGSRARW